MGKRAAPCHCKKGHTESNHRELDAGELSQRDRFGYHKIKIPVGHLMRRRCPLPSGLFQARPLSNMIWAMDVEYVPAMEARESLGEVVYEVCTQAAIHEMKGFKYIRYMVSSSWMHDVGGAISCPATHAMCTDACYLVGW